MRRWLGWLAIGWMLALCVLALAVYGQPHAQTSLGARTRAVAQGLRCPVCQGESVADSPSGIAAAMRAQIRKDLARGESEAAIQRYFVARYGDWILLAPPASGVGGVAWLAPPLLLLGGVGLLLTLVADWKRRGRARAGAEDSPYLDRVRRELAELGAD